ncbi:MAG: hypothetical protein M0C28_01960 [Candidatus Moduliflexus flocculans]|nr:hypothetical protein [Candidatus Moduliflexus flocculans]
MDFILKDLPKVQGKDRRPLAYGFQAGLFPASVRTGDPLRPVSRAELAMALARVVKDHQGFLQDGDLPRGGQGHDRGRPGLRAQDAGPVQPRPAAPDDRGRDLLRDAADPPRRGERPLAGARRPGRLPRGLLPAELQRPRPVVAVQPLAGPQDAGGAGGAHQPVLPDRLPRRHRRQSRAAIPAGPRRSS